MILRKFEVYTLIRCQCRKMKFYTERYFAQNTLEGHPSVRIVCDEPGHWVCAQWRESVGRNGHEHHLVDNYGAKYVCRVFKQNDVINIEPGNAMRLGGGYGANYEITLQHKPIYLYPLADHMIDVLQTTILDSSIETLRRCAAEFAKRCGEIHRVV